MFEEIKVSGIRKMKNALILTPLGKRLIDKAYNISQCHNEGDTPPLWYAVFSGVLGRTQYAKGQYAVRNNSVKSYAALKTVNF